MYKLLVVDDEPIIVDGLFDLFKDWDRYAVDVYKAYSGAEALEWLAKKRIDVVITDIKMPGIDGMQLLARIRHSWPGCKVVFLTGYDEFEYVYEAIRHDGVSYLLKTESYEKIADTVGGCLEQIRKSMIDEEWMLKAKSQLEKALPMLQKEFLGELLDGTAPEVDQGQLDELSLPLRAAEPVLLIAGMASDPANPAGGSARSRYYSVNFVMEKHMAPYASVAYTAHKQHMMWVVQAKDDSDNPAAGEKAVNHLRGILESVQAVCRETLRLNVSFVISGSAGRWSDIAARFASLQESLRYFTEADMEAVLIDGGGHRGGDARIDTGAALQNVKLQLKKTGALEAQLEQGKRETFLAAFRELTGALTERPNHAAVSCEIFYSLSLLFLSYLNRHGMWEAVSASIDYEKLTRLDRHSSVEEAFSYFEQAAVHIFDVQNVESEKRSVASVQKVRQHIEEHPGGDLSLSTLADLVYFNPKYLSRLFKRVTGVNLSDYIAEVKLNKVKELLRQNRLKIHEVAEQAGYFSAPCFTRFFKRATGMTPQEYRDSSLNAGPKQEVDRC